MTQTTDEMIAEIERRAAAAPIDAGPDYAQIVEDVARENDTDNCALYFAFLDATITEPN